MRFPLAYYLMLIYVTVIFKPLIPVISDAYAHVFGEAIHLATVHAKYGSHHLEKALATNENSGSQKSINPQETYQIHLNSAGYEYDFILNDAIVCCHFPRSYRLSEIYLSRVIPPPKC